MINPLDPNKVIKEEQQKDPVEKPQESLLRNDIVEEAEIHAIAHSMGLDKMTDVQKHQDQIKRVVEWAKLKGALSLTDIVTEINSLRNKVGNKNIYNMSVYAGLELDRMRIEQQLRKME